MHRSPFWKCRVRSLLIALVLTAVVPMISPSEITPASGLQPKGPSIQITKKRCEGRDVFPVFVESHCVDVPDASFEIRDSEKLHAERFPSGEWYEPDTRYFSGSYLWSLTDLSRDPSAQGVRVVSCLVSEPWADWRSSALRVIHPGDSGGVMLDWISAAAGESNEEYQPSVECVWLELPDIHEVPAVLSLQVFTADAPYLNWTETTGPRLPDLARGESGEDLEAQMVMTNTDTGEVYSFAADAYGQVVVPPGTYSLVESANGLEQYFSMGAGDTTLVEVGLSAPVPLQSAPQQPSDTGTFAAGALYCDAAGCSAIAGVTIYYESMDGSLSGYCVTEVMETPNGFSGWCDYPFIEGMPTILTLDESTLPPGLGVTSENPQTYLVPEHPDGPLGPVFFQVSPS